MSSRVLMVDDEEGLARATTEYLTLCGVTASYVTDAESAEAAIAAERPELVLLDVNLPGASGFELCQRLRAASAELVILFLSARDTESDQILGFGLGGDDYPAKPFSMAVLLAKVQRMLTRAGQQRADEAAGFADGWLVVDLAASRVWVDGAEIQLPATEYRLLAMLVANQGRVVAKTELLDEIWNGSFVSEGTLSVHIRRLRTRIEPRPEQPVYLRTIWGRGFLFEQPGR